jgi:hypothetical protein
MKNSVWTNVIRTIQILFAAVILMQSTACRTLSSKDKAVVDSFRGKMIYSKSGMHGEMKGNTIVIQSTGYIGLPIFYPPNSAFKLVDANSKVITLRRGSGGETIQLRFVQRHSMMTLGEFLKSEFSNKEVTVASTFSEQEKKNIKAGTVEPGMRKQAVLMAIGQPPRSLNASSNGDSLVYAKSRVNNVELRFDRNRLVEIVD